MNKLENKSLNLNELAKCPANHNHEVVENYLFNCTKYQYCKVCKEDISVLQQNLTHVNKNNLNVPRFELNDSFIGIQLFNFVTKKEECQILLNSFYDVEAQIVMLMQNPYYFLNKQNILIKLLVKRQNTTTYLHYCTIDAFMESLKGR